MKKLETKDYKSFTLNFFDDGRVEVRKHGKHMIAKKSEQEAIEFVDAFADETLSTAEHIFKPKQ